MTTIEIKCKKCRGVIQTAKAPSCFDTTVTAWGRIYGFIHAIRHHWSDLTIMARFWAPFYCVTRPVCLIFALLWDLFRLVLWAVTWPFWWLHEEVL